MHRLIALGTITFLLSPVIAWSQKDVEIVPGSRIRITQRGADKDDALQGGRGDGKTVGLPLSVRAQRREGDARDESQKGEAVSHRGASSKVVETQLQETAGSTLRGDSTVVSSGVAEEQIPGLKSGTRAFWWSFLGTAVPAALGAFDVYRGGSSDSIVPGIALVAGLLFGPSLGHFYADRSGPALVGIGIRTLAGAGVAVAAAETLGEGTDYTLGWLAVVGAVLGGASLVWDIARAPHSAHVHNDQIRQDHVSIGITPSISPAGVGLCAELSF